MPVNVPDLITGLEDIPNRNLAVAVSGGGDSVALLHLLAKRGPGLRAVTVDHGLRDESAAEANGVAALCAELGVAHSILKWNDWDKQGNLQDAARRARLRLIGAWAQTEGVSHIALGHTMDDQAETVLMRLARGSGVDGLSGMAAVRQDDAVTWLRPLLGVKRADLRTYLQAHEVSWIDDPSNEDLKYDRVKARAALGHLETLGINVTGLAETATRMRDARAVLEHATVALADECVDVTEVGDVCISKDVFTNAPDELRFRLMAGILRWVSGEEYRPRFDSLRKLLSGDGDKTLHGCIIRSSSGKLIVRRELSKVEATLDASCTNWDRWELGKTSDATDAQTVGALGEEGLKLCVEWRETGYAREALLTTPALWSRGELIAAPMARMPNGWFCRLKGGEKGLYDVLMTR